MSNGYWQTERQRDLLPSGKLITERVAQYLKTWENRCYSNGIPEEVPKGLQSSNRAPSYKAIAVAILSNDHQLLSLGFVSRKSAVIDAIIADKQKIKNTFDNQSDMFLSNENLTE